MDEGEIINEGIIKNSDIKIVDLNLIKAIKSICKIVYKNKYGTGFFIKLDKNGKELYCLLTNEHVIKQEMIELKQIINIYFYYEDDYEKQLEIKLNKNQRYIKSDPTMDYTLIEIIPADKIEKKYFLLPNIDNINLINKDIYIVQFPEGKQLSYSNGKIRKIFENKLFYDASTKGGSSGSPIFLKNSTKIIGMHKGFFKDKDEENCGILINSIIQSLQPKKLDNNFIEIYENGDYYMGQGLNGKRHGNGIVFDKNNNIKYEGAFINGKYVGNYNINDYEENDENDDINNFIKEKFESIGNYVDENGINYKGPWLNGEKHGKGEEYYKNGKLKYSGEFVDGKYEGNGLFYKENGDYYIGPFAKGKKKGKGMEYYENGELKYEGNFDNDEYEGNGKYYDVNGDIYKGKFMNGKFKGIIFDKDGNIKSNKKSIFPELNEEECEIF